MALYTQTGENLPNQREMARHRKQRNVGKRRPDSRNDRSVIVKEQIRMKNWKVKKGYKVKELKGEFDDTKTNTESCNLPSFQSSFVKLDQIEISSNILAPFAPRLLQKVQKARLFCGSVGMA